MTQWANPDRWPPDWSLFRTRGDQLRADLRGDTRQGDRESFCQPLGALHAQGLAVLQPPGPEGRPALRVREHELERDPPDPPGLRAIDLLDRDDPAAEHERRFVRRSAHHRAEPAAVLERLLEVAGDQRAGLRAPAMVVVVVEPVRRRAIDDALVLVRGVRRERLDGEHGVAAGTASW